MRARRRAGQLVAGATRAGVPLVVAALALGPGSGTALAQDASTQVTVAGGALVIQAQPGVANHVTLSYLSSSNELLVNDVAGAAPPQQAPSDPTPPPCRSEGPTLVLCDASTVVLRPTSPSIGVQLGDGDDTVSGDVSLGETFSFTAFAGGGSDTMSGSPGADFLLAGGGRDRAMGGPGNDALSGEEGNDLLRGYAGNDVIGGGSGNDRQFGGSGNDWIWTADNQRDPVINCGRGRDRQAIIDRGKDARPQSC